MSVVTRTCLSKRVIPNIGLPSSLPLLHQTLTDDRLHTLFSTPSSNKALSASTEGLLPQEVDTRRPRRDDANRSPRAKPWPTPPELRPGSPGAKPCSGLASSGPCQGLASSTPRPCTSTSHPCVPSSPFSTHPSPSPPTHSTNSISEGIQAPCRRETRPNQSRSSASGWTHPAQTPSTTQRYARPHRHCPLPPLTTRDRSSTTTSATNTSVESPPATSPSAANGGSAPLPCSTETTTLTSGTELRGRMRQARPHH